jgi:hypothetical protein
LRSIKWSGAGAPVNSAGTPASLGRG